MHCSISNSRIPRSKLPIHIEDHRPTQNRCWIEPRLFDHHQWTSIKKIALMKRRKENLGRGSWRRDVGGDLRR
jgi:hypothetical protein